MALYCSPEYPYSRHNIIILFRKYTVDIRSEAWLNIFWEYINGNLFTVYCMADLCRLEAVVFRLTYTQLHSHPQNPLALKLPSVETHTSIHRAIKW
jgi:hypothetical protein